MLNHQVIGGLAGILLSFNTANAQNIELPPKEPCPITEENLTAHYTIIPNIYNAQGKTIMRFMNKQSPDEKARCGMMYEIESIKPFGTGIIINYKKGVKIDGDKGGH